MVLLADIASTGFSGAESANIRIGDTVAVFAQGPIGLCATAGAKLIGASLIIGVESDPVRMEMSKRMGAHVVLDPKQCDVVAEIKKLTGGGADVAIEALGLQVTFENALRCLRARRHVEQPRRLLRKTSGSVRRVRSRPWRLQDRDHTLPGRERTDAPADVDGAIEALRPAAVAHAQVQARSNRGSIYCFRLAPRRVLKSGDHALMQK